MYLYLYVRCVSYTRTHVFSVLLSSILAACMFASYMCTTTHGLLSNIACNAVSPAKDLKSKENMNKCNTDRCVGWIITTFKVNFV